MFAVIMQSTNLLVPGLNFHQLFKILPESYVFLFYIYEINPLTHFHKPELGIAHHYIMIDHQLRQIESQYHYLEPGLSFCSLCHYFKSYLPRSTNWIDLFSQGKNFFQRKFSVSLSL